MVVAAVDAHHLGAKHLRAKNFRGLKIGRNKNPRLEALASRLRRHCVRQIPRRRASHRFEPKAARIGQRHGNHAILEAQGGEAHGIILDEEPPRSNLVAQPRHAHQRGISDREGGQIPRWQRQQLAIAPEIRRARGDQVARNALADRIVIVGDFER